MKIWFVFSMILFCVKEEELKLLLKFVSLSGFILTLFFLFYFHFCFSSLLMNEIIHSAHSGLSYILVYNFNLKIGIQHLTNFFLSIFSSICPSFWFNFDSITSGLCSFFWLYFISPPFFYAFSRFGIKEKILFVYQLSLSCE